MNETAEKPAARRVESPAAKDPAVRMFIFAAMLLLFGTWCFLDAFVRGKYPYPANGDVSDLAGYYFNHVGGIVLPLVGLVPLAWGIVFLKRRMIADEVGLGYARGRKIPWSDVTRLDAADLADKGILRL
ncbi:MAG: hypothetical protein J7M21_01990, partial [Planctomycetes bacterium]|nr:hypothetical protein [Planctomycetota bacterium]